MVSACGYITQFNRETNVGRIETEGDKRCLRFHLYSLKKNSRRYVNTDDATFAGELFDFKIIQHTDETEDEAINIRHRVLSCPTLGCSRIKAFTNRKALEEHIENKHRRVRKAVESTAKEATSKKTGKSMKKPSPFLVNLPAQSTFVVGRFIGKSGVRLKQFQQANHVHLKILSKPTFDSLLKHSNLQIQVRPLKASVNAQEVTKELKLLWNKAAREQKEEEESFHRLLLCKESESSTIREVEFDSDTRRARAFTISGDEIVRRRSTEYRQAEVTLRRHHAHSTLSLEGHRCAATGDRQQGATKSVVALQKKKSSMKDKHWLLKEQLDEL